MVAAQQQDRLRQVDLALVAVIFLISVFGMLAIKSALHLDPEAMIDVKKQAVGIVLGGAAMIWLAQQEYEGLLKRFARYLYPINLLALLAVLKAPVQHASHGAARWIKIAGFQIQPSEFAKLIIVITLALFIRSRIDTIRTWPTLLRTFGHVALPMALIAKQPDLGTALVLLAIWFGMVSIAGAKPSHLLIFVASAVLLFGVVWRFSHFLKPYQKQRLEVFLNPESDPRDTGYHLRQSEIAIGSGELYGEGYGKGSQSNGRFIPEQHTDFIFTVVAEEGGFVGSLVLLCLYLFVLLRGVGILAACRDPLGRLLAAGVLSMLTFHVVVNAGMTMGVMPVVGVPLPFFSYGLSSLLVNMAAVGLLLSVAGYRHRSMF